MFDKRGHNAPMLVQVRKARRGESGQMEHQTRCSYSYAVINFDVCMQVHVLIHSDACL